MAIKKLKEIMKNGAKIICFIGTVYVFMCWTCAVCYVHFR